jgi:hypothetical protein
MRQVGLLRTNILDNDALTAITKFIVKEVLPKCIVVVERNYLGIVLLGVLAKDPAIEPRLFYLEKEKDAERTIGKLVVRSRKKTRVYGVDTQSESRDAMMRYLFQMMDESPELFALERFQDEVRTLQRKKTGKIEHRAGFHDDVLMSYLIGVYADRHQQPIMRRLLSAANSDRRQIAASGVTVMNMENGTTAAAAAAALAVAGKTGIDSVDEYVRRETERKLAELDQPDSARRRRILSNMISNLNGGPDTPL